jgi:hypothetical protein
MEGARALRFTIDRTHLWRPDETQFFKDVISQDDGERYVEVLMLPKQIRFHKRFQDWREQGLTDEVRAELREAERRFRGE